MYLDVAVGIRSFCLRSEHRSGFVMDAEKYCHCIGDRDPTMATSER